MPPLTLYSRAGCHLCELAQAALTRLEFRVQVVDIAGNADLEARYGNDIPVLTRATETGTETGQETLLKGVISGPRLSALKLRLMREQGSL